MVVVVAFFSIAAFSAFEATFSLFGERRLRLNEGGVSAVFVAVGIVISVVQGGMLGRLTQRLGEVRTLRMGLLLNGFGLASLALVYRWWQLLLPLLLLCPGQGLASPSLTLVTVNRTDPAHRGAVLGVQQSAGSLARVLGPLLGGVLFQHVGVPAPYIVGAGLLVGCVGFVAVVGAEPRPAVVS